MSERLAALIMKACESRSEIRTLEDCARAAATSRTTFAHTCHLLGLRAYDVRDFARVLREIVRRERGIGHGEPVLFGIADRRTLTKLRTRVGLPDRPETPLPTAKEFLIIQRLIEPNHEVLRLIDQHIGGCDDTGPVSVA